VSKPLLHNTTGVWSYLFRGRYSRVAKKLGVDASYVSRVARGERQSAEIERALNAELVRIDKRRPK
jgi:predicted transcriptional regulator